MSGKGECLPRMRGDRPLFGGLVVVCLLFTPHARGSTLSLLYSTSHSPVYPACAGIDRYQVFLLIRGQGLPRMRGDRPRRRASGKSFGGFTPHARGSTFRLWKMFRVLWVYPACAGIDRLEDTFQEVNLRLPRMRGDRPSLFVER